MRGLNELKEKRSNKKLYPYVKKYLKKISRKMKHLTQQQDMRAGLNLLENLKP